MIHKDDEINDSEEFSTSQGLPDVGAILEFLGQFKGAQQHLLQAGVELVSAASVALESLLKSLEKDYPKLRQKWEFLYGMQYGLGFVASYLGKNVNSSARTDKKDEHKLAALESIIEVLEREMEKLSDAINQTTSASGKSNGGAAKDAHEKQVQIAAMLAIKNVLERELRNAGKSPKKKPGSRAPHAGQGQKRTSGSSKGKRRTKKEFSQKSDD